MATPRLGCPGTVQSADVEIIRPRVPRIHTVGSVV